VDLAALLHHFRHDGRIAMGRQAELGLHVYTRLWAALDALFPEAAPPGRRYEKELNEQVGGSFHVALLT